MDATGVTGRGQSCSRGNTPRPCAPSPYYAEDLDQFVLGISSPIGWSSPSSATQAYPQGIEESRSPQWGGIYRSDNGASQNAFRQQGNATPSVLGHIYRKGYCKLLLQIIIKYPLLQDECRAWFFFATDQEGDGTLSSEEMRSALLSIGACGSRSTR